MFGARAAATTLRQGLGTHSSIRVRLGVILGDSWDSGENLVVKVDGTEVWRSPQIVGPYQSLHICGSTGSGEQGPIYIDLVVPHTSSSASIVITSTLNEQAHNEWWQRGDGAC